MAERSDIDQVAPEWVEDVLGFWFGLSAAEWFAKSRHLDDECATRFAALHPLVAAMSADEAVATPRRALAAVIMLDQFSRNIHRDTPQAFASDGKALAIARLALERGHDTGLSADQRLFIYLPFEHSEDRADQDTSVELFSALGEKTYLDYAVAHRDIVVRFGRFPHRNAILGRPSTPEEVRFLQEPGSSF